MLFVNMDIFRVSNEGEGVMEGFLKRILEEMKERFKGFWRIRMEMQSGWYIIGLVKLGFGFWVWYNLMNGVRWWSKF